MVAHPTSGSSATDEAFLGIDLGTSSVKAVVTDGRGAVLTQAVATYLVDSPRPAWAETDPEQWWAAIVTAVREVVATGVGPIRGIGLSGQMHAVVPTDAFGDALRPAMTWADSRAVDQLALYRALPERLRARLANPLVPGMAGPMLAWLAENEPAVYLSTRWALQPKDWVRARLTGEFASEPSDASATLLYDVLGGQWDEEVVRALGLDPELLPPQLPHSASIAGSLLGSAADQLGLPSGIPVAAGAADAAAAALGSGLTRETDVQLTIGTGVQIVVPEATASIPDRPASIVTHLYRSAAPHGWYRMAAIQSGGLALSWVIRVLGASWTELYDTAAGPVRVDDPVFLPHLSGERTPYLDPSLRGAWIGLDLRHDRTTLLRTALEGVAFTIGEALDSLPGVAGRAGQLRIAGGGSQAATWQQMLADVLGHPLQAVHVPAASGRGAALLGACAAGRLDERSLPDLLTPQSRSAADPDQHRIETYAERRHEFRRLVHTLQQTSPPHQPEPTQRRSHPLMAPAPAPAVAIRGARHP